MEKDKYKLTGVSITDVTEEIDALWGKLQEPGSDAALEAMENGVSGEDLEELRQFSREEALPLDNGGAMGPVAIALIVAFAPVAAKITKDVWDKFILPRLERRFGRNAVTVQP
ncbi:MAG: hypothetical protein WAM70_08935 [Pyrinomonadaceae bacterium]